MKRLKLLILLLTLCSGLYSQTIEVNRADLIRVLKKAEQCKVDSMQLVLVQGQQSALIERLNTKDITINTLDASVKNLQVQIRTYENLNGNNEKVIQLLKEDVKAVEKVLRKQKRKSFFLGAAGIVGMGTLTYLFISK